MDHVRMLSFTSGPKYRVTRVSDHLSLATLTSGTRSKRTRLNDLSLRVLRSNSFVIVYPCLTLRSPVSIIQRKA